MLKVIQYLQNNSLEELNKEYGIIICNHNSLPLTILNYDQISSPINEITNECRSLIINRESKTLISRSFLRFFNWGQYPEQQSKFNWAEFTASSKEDGSLCHIFNWEGKWFANTRGSFGEGSINNWTKTWQEAFCEAMGLSCLQELEKYLAPDLSYSCEFVSPYNKVVRSYAKPAMYFLSAFEKEKELPFWGKYLNNRIFLKPEIFEFHSLDEILFFLKQKEISDSTFEGVVICDNKFNRWKLKSDSYRDLHRLKNNGNISHPKNFLNFILNGTDDDLVAKLPELKEIVEKWREIVKTDLCNIVSKWEQVHHIENQKEFALAVKDHAYAGVFFNARKTKCDPKEVYKNSSDLILKKNGF